MLCFARQARRARRSFPEQREAIRLAVQVVPRALDEHGLVRLLLALELGSEFLRMIDLHLPVEVAMDEQHRDADRGSLPQR